MLAARLHEGAHDLRLEQVAVPEPKGDEILVRVAGCGVCRSDIHVLDGLHSEFVRPPVTMGHEISGWVAGVGEGVGDLKAGEAVAVMVGWGCGYCEWCVTGREQLCPQGVEAGSTADGGFAEFVLVPGRRHLVRLGQLDPIRAAPLGDAALSAYAAVKRVHDQLRGDATAVVIGLGGLGQYAVEFLHALSAARVVAVDLVDEQLALARELGADEAVHKDKAAAAIQQLTHGRGAQAVLDFVGSDESLSLAAEAVARRGVIGLLGLAGGTVPFGFYTLRPEASITTVHAGTIFDLHQVVELARRGTIATRVTTYALEDVNSALGDLRNGRVAGRAVITPS
jgi:alcohol dehydrogenase, propanol-preferring